MTQFIHDVDWIFAGRGQIPISSSWASVGNARTWYRSGQVPSGVMRPPATASTRSQGLLEERSAPDNGKKVAGNVPEILGHLPAVIEPASHHSPKHPAPRSARRIAVFSIEIGRIEELSVVARGDEPERIGVESKRGRLARLADFGGDHPREPLVARRPEEGEDAQRLIPFSSLRGRARRRRSPRRRADGQFSMRTPDDLSASS